MKTITFLLMLMCTLSVSFGQVLRMAVPEPGKQQVWNEQHTNPGHTKGSGDVIWQTSFNWKDVTSPQGWSLPDGWVISVSKQTYK